VFDEPGMTKDNGCQGGVQNIEGDGFRMVAGYAECEWSRGGSQWRHMTSKN